MENDDPQFRDAEFMFGYALATRTMIRALAVAMGVEEAWQAATRERLQTVLDQALATRLPDRALLAIEQARDGRLL